MPNRECRLLVLSPRARNWNHVQEYTPFPKGERLVATIAAAASRVAQRRHRDYDEHVIFRGFFFGATTLDTELKGVLGDDVPSSVIDCSVYRSAETDARETAEDALFHFAYGFRAGGKLIILICNDGCGLKPKFDTWYAPNDGALFAHLESDLSTNVFKRVGNVMAGRVDD
jgi:hypothetical protein